MATARTIACRFLAPSAALIATLALGATPAQAQAVAPQDSSVGAASAQGAGAAGPSERSSQPPVKFAAGCDAATAKLQRTLRDLRYAIGRTDGCDSAATRAAIQAFQKAQGLDGRRRRRPADPARPALACPADGPPDRPRQLRRS